MIKKNRTIFEYFKKVKEQISAKTFDITTIDSETIMMSNLIENDIPASILNNTHENYEDFLQQRRKLMSYKIKEYYYSL